MACTRSNRHWKRQTSISIRLPESSVAAALRVAAILDPPQKNHVILYGFAQERQ
jgi:hypothetical protein